MAIGLLLTLWPIIVPAAMLILRFEEMIPKKRRKAIKEILDKEPI
jgi:hypothetical protein